MTRVAYCANCLNKTTKHRIDDSKWGCVNQSCRHYNMWLQDSDLNFDDVDLACPKCKGELLHITSHCQQCGGAFKHTDIIHNKPRVKSEPKKEVDWLAINRMFR